MFPIRRAALRLISTPSFTAAIRPRTITSLTSATLRSTRPSTSSSLVSFQRRWASNEAEAKRDEVPISTLQPTAQEEVENAISEDNAAGNSASMGSAPPADVQAAAVAESTGEPHVQEAGREQSSSSYGVHEANESTSSRAPESASVENAIGSVGGAGSQNTYDASKPRPPVPNPSVYVGNLFFDVTENDLQKEFSRFGEIKNVRIIRDPRGLSKGFGYIEYETTEQASQAIAELNQQLFEGRRLYIAFSNNTRPPSRRDGTRANKGPMNPPSKTLFIGNMSFEMTDRDLNALFKGIRNVIDVRVAIDRRTGQPRGFAHADFVDVKSAQEAFKVLESKEVYGRMLRVDYSYGPSTAPRNQENK